MELKEIIQEAKNRGKITAHITVEFLEAQQKRIEELEEDNKELKEITEVCCEPSQRELLRLEKENTELRAKLKEFYEMVAIEQEMPLPIMMHKEIEQLLK